jgi:hypothetical protein
MKYLCHYLKTNRSICTWKDHVNESDINICYLYMVDLWMGLSLDRSIDRENESKIDVQTFSWN